MHEIILNAVKHRKNIYEKGEVDRLLIDVVMDLDLPQSTILDDLLIMFIGGFHTTGSRKLFAIFLMLSIFV